ncbi:MAG: hypothetical protein ABIQ47_11390 [Tepidiformaceae bacterium]
MNKFKMFGGFALGAALLTSAFGFAAGVSGPGGNAGVGSEVVGGFTTSAISFTLNGGGNVVGASFSTSPNATTALFRGQGANTTAPTGVDDFPNWSCTIAGSVVTCTTVNPVATGTLNSVTIVLGS